MSSIYSPLRGWLLGRRVVEGLRGREGGRGGGEVMVVVAKYWDPHNLWIIFYF